MVVSSWKNLIVVETEGTDADTLNICCYVCFQVLVVKGRGGGAGWDWVCADVSIKTKQVLDASEKENSKVDHGNW